MKFVHDDRDFPQLLRIVAERVRIATALVEKDYWVTHTLWALLDTGFEIWLKGGTSLSKGFGLIERFSEDLDLKVEPGRVAAVSPVANWRSAGTTAARARAAYFDALGRTIAVAGARVQESADRRDAAHRSAEFRVVYAGRHVEDLPASMRPFVLLEIGSARVTPAVERDMTSFVHDELARIGQLGAFTDNRPRGVRCVHPHVTLLEKLDALRRRVPREDVPPATFVRHYEDAARIVRSEASLPELQGVASLRDLAEQMVVEKQIAAVPEASDPAFNLVAGARRDAILRAHADIGPMFWGPRIGIDEACALLRGWIGARLLAEPGP